MLFRSVGADRQQVEALLEDASDDALHTGLLWMAALLVAGGLISAAGIRNRPRPQGENG